MAKRRSRGEGAVFWVEERQRWVATVDLGYTPAGKRRRAKASFQTKTKAKAWLRDKLRDVDDGLALAPYSYTVEMAVREWLTYGMTDRDPSTVENRTILAERHIVPALGKRKLRDLTADEVDEWLASKTTELGSETLKRLLSILRRSINRAQARDKVKRNVALLCSAPKGRPGRPSKSLTLAQAEALLVAADDNTTVMGTYVVVALLTGARTEELRPLTWDHVSLESEPPYIAVWRSVRAGGDTKTKKSRRTLKLPARCADALIAHREAQQEKRRKAGKDWSDQDLVFGTAANTPLDAANVRRAFRDVARAAGLNEKAWTPRELRHSFVSLLSDAGVPIEDISRLVGHRSTLVTETVYRFQLRPVLTEGAEVMDTILGLRRAKPDA